MSTGNQPNHGSEVRTPSRQLAKTAVAGVILLSLIIQFAAMALSAGYSNADAILPPEVSKTIGFNNPITYPRIGQLMGSATLRGIAHEFNWLTISLVAAHLLALALMFEPKSKLLWGTFCIVQVPSLFWGGFGFLMLIFSRWGNWTGESIVEGTLSIIASSAIWFVISVILATRLAFRYGQLSRNLLLGRASPHQTTN